MGSFRTRAWTLVPCIGRGTVNHCATREVPASVLCFGFWPRSMWDLSSLTRDQTCTPCIGRQSLNHWTAREVPVIFFFLIFIYLLFLYLFWLRWVLVEAGGLLSCGVHVGSSSLSRDWTQAPCIVSVESYPLDHQGSPLVICFKYSNVYMSIPNSQSIPPPPPLPIFQLRYFVLCCRVLFCVLLLSCSSSLCILDINLLSDIWFANIFSHSIGCHFTLAIVSFAVQKAF